MYSPDNYDTLIIGAGPAGLAAAMSLGRAGRRAAVFDSQEYRNETAREMHNVVLHDGQSPIEFRSAAMEAIAAHYPTITFIDSEVKSVAASPRSHSFTIFTVQTVRGVKHQGKKLIFATGSRDVIPQLPGYSELWGDGIIHCLFCDGYEKRGGPIGVLGLDSLHDISPTLMAYHLSNTSVTIFLNGERPTTEKQQMALRAATARGCQINTGLISHLSRNDRGVQIAFHDGSRNVVTFLMHAPDTVNRAQQLINSLGVKTVSEGLHIEPTTAFGETNVRGCFAAGDTATASKMVAVALATGAMAGIGAAKQLALDEACHAAFPAGNAANKI